MTRIALEGFGKGLLASDEVFIEATGHAMAVSRVLSPFVTRLVIVNPLQAKTIAHDHVKTDKIDVGVLVSLYAAGYLPESGRLTRRPNVDAGSWPADTRAYAIAPGLKKRCTRSCMRT